MVGGSLPTSNSLPCSWKVWQHPPAWSCCSSTSTRLPTLARVPAAARPPMPLPMTTASRSRGTRAALNPEQIWGGVRARCCTPLHPLSAQHAPTRDRQTDRQMVRPPLTPLQHPVAHPLIHHQRPGRVRGGPGEGVASRGQEPVGHQPQSQHAQGQQQQQQRGPHGCGRAVQVLHLLDFAPCGQCTL